LEIDKMAKNVKRNCEVFETEALLKNGGDFFSRENGVDQEEAIQEAQRCLGTRPCDSCETCSLLCPDLCITRNEETGEVGIDLDYCKGCGICAAVCPKGAIQMVWEEGA
jgi:2-oxoacid:acceptor oxidoreductase delta subunit (pyruvate/2-ketoisovalerate family)